MRTDLIELLADGELHSGADLARRLGCSRTAIWKQLQQLQALDLEVVAKPGSGYRLTRPIELLDAQLIRERLEPRAVAGIESLEVLTITESTNEHLRQASAASAGRMKFACAEYQTGGRGRRGRRWLSPFGSGLCMSAGWTFAATPPNLPALSLAAGVATHRVLAARCPAGLGLKWPNDIVVGGAKLGGLLIDVHGESTGPISVVVGIGINIDPVAGLAERFDGDHGLPPVGLRELVGDGSVSRNHLAADFAGTLFDILLQFESTGFESFADEWRRYDAMKGSAVLLRIGAESHSGTAMGIDENGALLFKDADGVRSVLSGEVTLRHAGAGEPA